MKSNIAKKCIICQDTFYPDRRVEKRQTVCEKPKCKREKKAQSQQQWSDENPGYFKGRYPQLKEQIIKNKKKSTVLHQHNCPSAKKGIGNSKKKSISLTGIQDEITVNKNNIINQNSIQDEITSRILIINYQFNEIIQLVYKMNQLSINQ
jgi:transcription initiation factor TFIIIB Brf1 subunit/transcription initiation factor TFIIB